MQKNSEAINVTNISKSYRISFEKRQRFIISLANFILCKKPKRKINALRNVSLSVKKGEFLGITGPNGGGKSTLLAIIYKILKPNSGEVTVNGKVSLLKLGLGFQPELSAKENVLLHSALLGIPESKTKRNFERIIKFAEVEGFEQAKLKDFSTGMRSRLAFATALEEDFDILLLDEVLAVGDIRFRKKCFEKIREFKKSGKTIILVSHEIESLKRYCDRVILMDKGQIIKDGETNKVLRYYSSSYK